MSGNNKNRESEINRLLGFASVGNDNEPEERKKLSQHPVSHALYKRGTTVEIPIEKQSINKSIKEAVKSENYQNKKWNNSKVVITDSGVLARNITDSVSTLRPDRLGKAEVSLPYTTYEVARQSQFTKETATKAAEFSNEYSCVSNKKDLVDAITKSVHQAVASHGKQVVKYQNQQQPLLSTTMNSNSQQQSSGGGRGQQQRTYQAQQEQSPKNWM